MQSEIEIYSLNKLLSNTRSTLLASVSVTEILVRMSVGSEKLIETFPDALRVPVLDPTIDSNSTRYKINSVHSGI